MPPPHLRSHLDHSRVRLLAVDPHSKHVVRPRVDKEVEPSIIEELSKVENVLKTYYVEI